MLDNIEKNLRASTTRIRADDDQRPKVLIIFGTRPEAIKLAPVASELKNRNFPVVVVSSSQHTDLLAPFLKLFELQTDYDLRSMRGNQTPSEVAARILSAFDPILEKESPEVVLVQGDTATAFSGAFAAFNRKIKIGHLEAGLRSGDPQSPFPEEMNRRLITQMATLHFAATPGNRQNLLNENITEDQIYETGNTVIDALRFILKKAEPSDNVRKLIGAHKNKKLILLTTHRRESFGEKLCENLLALRRFVENHPDVFLMFPVHPNPNVRKHAEAIMACHERIFLHEPLDYIDFISLMKHAWLLISDSGGVQEEAPSLGKPLLVLRENTERPEAIESGIAKLVGGRNLETLLEENYNDESWIESVRAIKNPFGDGAAARRIVDILEKECFLASQYSKTYARALSRV